MTPLRFWGLYHPVHGWHRHVMRLDPWAEPVPVLRRFAFFYEGQSALRDMPEPREWCVRELPQMPEAEARRARKESA